MLTKEEIRYFLEDEELEIVSSKILESMNPKDSGRFGKIGEIMVKYYINGYRGNSLVVSGKGKTDVKYHGLTLEIKSNCGELEKISKNDFVVYTMDNRTDYNRPQDWKVIPAAEFFQMMEKLGLVREKKTTAGYIKTTIQSYNNSKRKTARLAEALEEYPSLREWKNTH